MDDPWGSPWAADPAAKLDLRSDQQRSHLKATLDGQSPRKLSADPTSPWGNGEEDDAWGGWNDATDAKDSPGWGRSPNFQPLGAGAPEEVSLDPWGGLDVGAKATITDLGVDADKSTEDTSITDDDDGNGAVRQILDYGGHESVLDGDRKDIELDEQSPKADNKLASELNDDVGEISLERTSSTEPDTMGQGAATTSHEEQSPKVDVKLASELNDDVGKISLQRTSSTEPDTMGQEAATTSHEEQRSEASRQSSKVLELVEMYDGMAKKSSSSLELPLSTTKTTLDEDHEAEPVPQETNLEVEEDGVVESERREEENEISNATPAEGQVVPADDEELDTCLSRKQTSENAADAASEAEELKLTQTTTSPASYPIDLSSLDTLFPGTQAVTPEPEIIPDRIPSDTFTSVAERKAWYRISRFGSIRKHNNGDDESYVRVNWNASTVRKETLVIVRRWMEEDSIGGRVVLGRRLGHGGASMFNWDSSAPPVEIGELLAERKKKKRGHVRQASETVRGTIMSPTAAAFSWSTSVPSSPLTSKRPPSSEWNRKSSQDGIAAIAPKEPPTSLSAKSVAFAGIDRPGVKTQETIKEDDDNDDDDWGEMISSPTMETSNSTSIDSVFDATPMSVSDGVNIEVKEQDELATGLNISVVESDPWGGLDSFDNGADTVSSMPPMPSPVSSAQTAPLESQTLNTTAEPKSVATSEPEKVSDIPPSPSLEATQPTKHKVVVLPERTSADNDIAADILRGLPDLSYMLR